MQFRPNSTLILSGVTASGKTALALEFAEKFNQKHGPIIEIINADSILIYKGLNIGSAKPSFSEQAKVPHHLIDIRNPNQSFSAGDFLTEFKQIDSVLEIQNKKALIVGGTGFYLKGLLYGIWDAPKTDINLRKKLELKDNETLFSELQKVDPVSSSQIHLNDRYRLVRALEIFYLCGQKRSEIDVNQNRTSNPRFKLLVTDRSDSELNERIHTRTEQMIHAGLLDEIKNLRDQYPAARCLDSVGYKEGWNYLNGIPPRGRKPVDDERGLIEEISLATRQLVKKQRTWFKSEPQSQFFTLEADQKSLMDLLWSTYETELK